MTLKTNTLQNSDFIKLVMMVLVVLEHSIAVTTDDWFHLNLEKNIGLHWVGWVLDQFHIFVFAMVSGYIFRYLRIERNHYPDFKLFAKKKAERLLIPLLFVSLVWTLPINSLYFGSGIKECLWLLIEGPSQLWFLYMLFGVYMMAWRFSETMEKLGLKLLPILMVFYFIGYYGFTRLPNPLQIWRIFMFSPFFYLGFLFRKEDADSDEKRGKLRPILVMGGVF